MSNLSSAAKTPISSSNHKSVVLHQWWLIKVEPESKLGVGGYVHRETLGSRGMRLLGSASIGKRFKLNTENQTEKQVFCSAEIEKRIESNTLESIDGIRITIIGCIHRSRTLSYGFPPEVCDSFICGFPLNWEGHFGKSCDDECCDTTKSTLPLSFDDLPVTRVCNVLMSTTQESESCAFTSIIIKDIMKQCNGSDSDELHKKEDGISGKTREETHEINSLPVEEDLETCKETEAARISSRAATEPKKCQVSGKKRKVIRTRDEYPLRSMRMKESN